MNTTQAYPRLMAALNEVRMEWRRQQLLEGALLALAGVAGILVVLVAADNLLRPGTLGRSLLALFLWGGLAVVLLSLVVRRWLEDHRDDYFAALVEHKYPELHNQLINALQLGRGNQRGFSPGLIEAIVHDAGRATLDLEMADSIDRRPTRRAGLWSLGALLIVGGYAAAFPPYFANGLARVLLPGGDIAPYTRTRIVADSLKPGETRVPEGEPIAFSVRVEGEVPDAAYLVHRAGSGAWDKTRMAADPLHPDTFHVVVAQAAESFEYYVGAGDAESGRFHVAVVKPPQVAKLVLTYTPPAYTALPPRPVADSDGEIQGVAGTVVALELKATKPLQKARLLLKGGQELHLSKRDDDRTWTGSFVLTAAAARLPADVAGEVVTAPTTYQVKLLDTDGFENADPLWRSIALAADQPPVVTIVGPGEKHTARPGEVVPLVVRAQDDYGLGLVRLLCQLRGREEVRELARYAHDGTKPELVTGDTFRWNLASGGIRAGDVIEYWAEAVDRNTITGPGKGVSRRFIVTVEDPLQAVKQNTIAIDDFVQMLEALLKLQRVNRTETAEDRPFAGLVERQTTIRARTRVLARALERDGRMGTVAEALDDLAAGLMAEALKLLESGRGTDRAERATAFRKQSLPVQDRIIKELEELLARLQRNELARKALKRLEKKDPAAHKTMTKVLGEMIKDLGQMLKDQTTLAGKFERLPKKGGDEVKEQRLKALNELTDLKSRTEKWAKGTVNELTKMGQGFVDDFNLRKDVNKVFEEIEKAEKRSKAQNADVALEDLGAGLGTKMKEDLEMWMMDSPDAVKWRLEEPLNKKPFKVPEMPLPKALEDLIGDLLQKADEFDEEADDVTSAWADNLDQAGWGVSDGPISSFSAKGKTGNDQPNNMEVSGRSGDGRRGKSSGQMVGDTARALPGRKTPARVGNEKYEPGQLKQEGQEDPNGATGGGKTAGAGRRGLQGGTPPPPSPRDIARLSAKQAGVREKAEQVARKLDTLGVTSSRLKESIGLMKSVEKDLADHRYEDASRRRRESLRKLRSAFSEMDPSTAARIHRARDLPPDLRRELLQSSDEAYPAGYEGLLKSYYKALSTAEKDK